MKKGSLNAKRNSQEKIIWLVMVSHMFHELLHIVE